MHCKKNNKICCLGEGKWLGFFLSSDSGILSNFFLCTKSGRQKQIMMYKTRTCKGCAGPWSAKSAPKERFAYMEISTSRDILV